MCGIVGWFNRDGAPVATPAIQAMCDAIVHRGPDDQGQFVSGSVGLGMRRLSIIDLAGGHQPMQNEDGALTIVFNGEIYNYREVRAALEARGHHFRTASDTESILHAYEEHGPACLDLLNGMFALAIWDAKRQQLFVARDRIGIKPLYVYENGQQLRFASEMKALLTDRTIPRDLDRGALTYFLRYGYVTPPATLFRSIRKLPPAHYLIADRGGVSVHRYWTLRYQEAEGSEEEHAEALYDALKRAVRRQLVADVPLGAFLSGGLDSSSIVHLMNEVTGTRVSTYSIGFAGADAFHSELADARSMSEREGTEHHEILVRPDVATLIPKLVYHLDEPLADSSFVVTYLVSTLAAQTVKVILSGVGGDELFGGYRRYLGPRLAPYYQRLPGSVRRGARGLASILPVDRGSYIRNVFRLGRAFVLAQELPPFEQYDQAVRMMPEAQLRRLSPHAACADSALDAERRDWFDKSDAHDDVTRMMHLDLNSSLVESLLMLTDKMTMATSLEARVPFLDHEVVELSARIPAALKVRGTKLRHIQKSAMRGHLPPSVLTKRKRGFGFPIGAWFRKDLREMTRDLLAPARLARHGLFDGAVVQELIEAHQDYREDYSDALLALLTFELWYDRWGAS
jgi:asparagine synthase (glutamine-hydrolysing)